jgi:hypothetical protein
MIKFIREMFLLNNYLIYLYIIIMCKIFEKQL